MIGAAKVLPFQSPRSDVASSKRFAVADATLWELAALFPQALDDIPAPISLDQIRQSPVTVPRVLEIIQLCLRSNQALSTHVFRTCGDWDGSDDGDRWFVHLLNELQSLVDQDQIESVCSSNLATELTQSPALSLKDSVTIFGGAVRQCQRRLRELYAWRHGIEQSARRMIYNFAYGLTHEINNPLANIAARAQQLIAHAPESDKKSLATIVDQAMRAHEMLSEMMLAVQPPKLNRTPTDIRFLLSRASQSFNSIATQSNITLNIFTGEQPLHSVCDAEALIQAIQVAIQNSFEACRAGDTIEIVAQRTAIDDHIGDDHTLLTTLPAEIRIAIIDNGPGMSPEAIQNAWDLYYSGREAGRGLGIGLCKLRRIVEGHDGRVWISSAPNAGTAIEIRLPFESPPRSPERLFV